MSIHVLSDVLRRLDGSTLDPASRLLLVLLADHTNDGNGAAWPSVSTLCGLTGLDRRNVQRRLARLRDLGVVEVVERPGRSSLYRLDPARVPASEGAAPPPPPPAAPPPPTCGASAAPPAAPPPPNPLVTLKEPARAWPARGASTPPPAGPAPSRPSDVRPCPRCRHVHHAGEVECPRALPPDRVAEHAAHARAALEAAKAARGRSTT